MTAPYYQDEHCVILLGDSLEALRDWPDAAAFDCVLTDPPYCSGASPSAQKAKRAGVTPESVKARPTIEMDSMGTLGYEWVSRKWLMDARRLTTPGGHLACFTDWRMAPWLQTMMEAAGWRLTNLVVWDKGYPGLGTGFRAQHEFVVVGSNGEPSWHSYDYGNVLKATRLTDTEHPHQKPPGILQKIITTCTPVGGLVLDPHMGSGTTLEAAKATGRKAVGVEIEERYCEIAARRLAQDAFDFGGVAS